LKVEPSRTIGDAFRHDLPRLSPRDRRAASSVLAKSLAGLLRKLHDRSVSDRDLKVANVLIRGEITDPQPALSVIDLAGARPMHPLPRARRLQNLSRMIVSLEELPGWNRAASLRFLRAYLGSAASKTTILRRWWTDVRRYSLAKRTRNYRRGRVLS